ncbi:DUF3054 domain-containing protein [Angustibacter luteus]|uniref:DUF3054 domain-containing protein n=1 Tax=Angustibacter luteus TaxID=658456 RepID=A0ABW1JAN7_9ACTN
MTRDPQTAAGPPPAFLLLDVLAVLVFATIGRISHDEGAGPVDVLGTAWPFLVGCAVGWALSRAWRRPTALRPVGVPVWLATVAIGMALRALADAGTELSFVVVTTLFLGLFMLGWRLVAGRFARGAR